MRFALATVALAVLAQQPAPDPFVAQHDAAAARSPLSSHFTIAFADARRAFHPGEAIPILFTFDGITPSPYNYFHWDHLGAARAVLDHTEGTVYPLGDYDRARIYDSGGIRCATLRRCAS